MVAIGRRLGYPMFLSRAPGHSFSRWDAPRHPRPNYRGYFNIEFHGGLSLFDDDHYFDFPVKWPNWQREQHRRRDPACQFLYSFTPAAELAHCLGERAVCLDAIGRYTESANAYHHASQLDPRYGGYAHFMRRSLRNKAEKIMRSTGFEPDDVRRWFIQRGNMAVAEALAKGGCWPTPAPGSFALPAPAVPFHPQHDPTPVDPVVKFAPPKPAGPGNNGHNPTTPSVSVSGQPFHWPDVQPQSPAQPGPTTGGPFSAFGPSPTNIGDIVQHIVNQTCAGTRIKPSYDLIFKNPPEPEVDPYASMRDENANLIIDRPE